MDFINDVTLKDSKLVFKTTDSNQAGTEFIKNAIEFDISENLKASFDIMQISSEIRFGQSDIDYCSARFSITGTAPYIELVGSNIRRLSNISEISGVIDLFSYCVYTSMVNVGSIPIDLASSAFNAQYDSYSGEGSVTIGCAAPLTVNSQATFNNKVIFNSGICTKTITSIAGTPIFDTTDNKGLNFKGLYTLNGFGTTDNPFFKQESATNNWINVTTLKEDGTNLEDKYALKTDVVSNYAQKATTLSGYGITDSYTKSEIDYKNTTFLTKESDGIQTISSDLALTGYVLIDNLSIDELNIESLTASSLVTLSGGLNVSGGIVTDSIKVGNDNVALESSLSNYVLKTDISNVYKYVGSVNSFSELPSNLTESDAGKVYNIVNTDETNNISAGDNVAWTGTVWDKLGGTVDLSNYAQKATTLSGYGITDSYTKSEIDYKNTTFLTKESDGIQTISSDLALTGYVLIDNLSIDELNIESLTASSMVTLSGGLTVTGGITVDGNEVAVKTDIPDVSDFKTPIFKYFQNPIVPESCTLFTIATTAEFENMPMMQLVRNSDNTIVSANISWNSNDSGGYNIMVNIDHSDEISANTYTLQAFGY